jgi:hypothetical protein
MYAGFPIWWLLGLANIGFVIVAIPMAYQLLKRRTIATPHGFGMAALSARGRWRVDAVG